MSLYEDDLDLSDYTAESIEKPDGVPPGWYAAMVSDVSKDEKTGALLVKFEVVHGEHKGEFITERLWDPKRSDDQKKADTSRKRQVLWAKRLGLVRDEDFGKPGVRIDWSAATGRFYGIEVKERKYKDKDDNEKIARNIDYAGVYPANHEKVPEELRKELAGLVGTGGGTGGGDASRKSADAPPRASNADYDGI